MNSQLTHVLDSRIQPSHARRTFCGLHVGVTTNVVLPRYLPGCTEKQWNICDSCEGRMALLELAETSLGDDDPGAPRASPRNKGRHRDQERTGWQPK